MKGAIKFAKRTPHLIGGKVGMAQKSTDPAFDQLNARFGVIEKAAEKLLKDSASFKDAVKGMLLSGAGFGHAFATLFTPSGNEYDLAGKHPQAGQTLAYLPQYDALMDELRDTLSPEIELIESRVLSPINEFQNICKTVRKNIVKRDHKLIDYDRINNSFTKLREKKEKTLKDEQSLFKLEQEFETASADYEYYNNAMKEELPRFFEMATRFITPLFHSFYYMQLNVFYLTLDKLQGFANGKFDITAAAGSVEDSYVAALSDASEKLEALTIRRPAVPSARVLAANRQNSTSSYGSKTGPVPGGLAANAPSRTGMLPSSSLAGTSAAAVAPPAYSPGAASSSTFSATGKRAPPPPPIKPKPGAASKVQHVVALYDYAATADGDLSFSAGDRIEVVERTGSTEDWWTGKLNGAQGVFPGNYVRDE